MDTEAQEVNRPAEGHEAGKVSVTPQRVSMEPALPPKHYLQELWVLGGVGGLWVQEMASSKPPTALVCGYANNQNNARSSY